MCLMKKILQWILPANSHAFWAGRSAINTYIRHPSFIDLAQEPQTEVVYLRSGWSWKEERKKKKETITPEESKLPLLPILKNLNIGETFLNTT